VKPLRVEADLDPQIAQINLRNLRNLRTK